MDFHTVISIAPFEWKSIFTALFCGGIIGLERQLRGKPVGIRTASLIVFGTYVFIAAANSFHTDNVDPTRIIGQIVTGVGFLGAGVMMTKDGVVMGVTSAATIWALAAIGVCISISNEWIAVKLSIIVVIILWGIEVLESYSKALTRGVHRKYGDWIGKTDKNSGSNDSMTQ